MRRIPLALAAVIAWVYAGYYRTLRLQGILPDGSTLHPAAFPFASQIFAICERDLPAVMGLAGRGHFTVLVAQGADGDWVASVAERLGCHVVRGSSRHGAPAAMLALVGAAVEGRPGVVTVDGPVGPAGVAKPGAIAWAAATGRPVLPVAAAARPALRLPATWSGMYLPLPGARVTLVMAPQVEAAGLTSRVSRSEACRVLTERLALARQRALQAINGEAWQPS